jgi:uncharacterized protein GlcG (DUF336 family)
VTSPVISLAAAQQALAAGARAAEEMGVVVSLAIVDAGGILRAFARMDGAEIAGEVIGGIGVSGAAAAQDVRCAEAVLAALDLGA